LTSYINIKKVLLSQNIASIFDIFLIYNQNKLFKIKEFSKSYNVNITRLKINEILNIIFIHMINVLVLYIDFILTYDSLKKINS
jgi:uncharacterized protein YpuA (DUF1002 family)